MEVDLQGPLNMARAIQENSKDTQRVFISSIMNIPPIQVDNGYKAVCVFTIKRSMLESGLMFFIAGRDETKGSVHGMPNFSVGHTDVVDDDLQKIYL